MCQITAALCWHFTTPSCSHGPHHNSPCLKLRAPASWHKHFSVSTGNISSGTSPRYHISTQPALTPAPFPVPNCVQLGKVTGGRVMMPAVGVGECRSRLPGFISGLAAYPTVFLLDSRGRRASAGKLWLQIPPACFTRVTQGRCFLRRERRKGSGLGYFTFPSSCPEHAGIRCWCFPATRSLAAECHMAPSSSFPSPGLHTAATCQQKSCYSIISPTGPAGRLRDGFWLGV